MMDTLTDFPAHSLFLNASILYLKEGEIKTGEDWKVTRS